MVVNTRLFIYKLILGCTPSLFSTALCYPMHADVARDQSVLLPLCFYIRCYSQSALPLYISTVTITSHLDVTRMNVLRI